MKFIFCLGLDMKLGRPEVQWCRNRGGRGGHWPPPIFGRSVNPIPTGEGRFSLPITTCTPNVFHLPASLKSIYHFPNLVYTFVEKVVPHVMSLSKRLYLFFYKSKTKTFLCHQIDFLILVPNKGSALVRVIYSATRFFKWAAKNLNHK